MAIKRRATAEHTVVSDVSAAGEQGHDPNHKPDVECTVPLPNAGVWLCMWWCGVHISSNTSLFLLLLLSGLMVWRGGGRPLVTAAVLTYELLHPGCLGYVVGGGDEQVADQLEQVTHASYLLALDVREM